MRKPLLFIAAIAFAITSCQKSSNNNGPFTCTCDYGFQRGFYWVADTTINTTYANGTSFTDAQLYCTNQETLYKSNVKLANVACYIH